MVLVDFYSYFDFIQQKLSTDNWFVVFSFQWRSQFACYYWSTLIKVVTHYLASWKRPFNDLNHPLIHVIDVDWWWLKIAHFSFSWWRIKWDNFPRYWPSVRGIHRSLMNSSHKGQWRGVLMFSLICPWLNGWVNNCEAGDLRRHHAHYDVIVMY